MVAASVSCREKGNQMRATGLGAFAALIAATSAFAQPQKLPHHFVLAGMTAERSSVVFVDTAHIEPKGPAVRVGLLLVNRQTHQIGSKPLLYASIDTVFDCQAHTMGFAEMVSFGPDGVVIDDTTTPPIMLAMPVGSSFGAAADVVCSGKSRFLEAPTFTDFAPAVAYGRSVLAGGPLNAGHPVT
jgi:hypothetical protein